MVKDCVDCGGPCKQWRCKSCSAKENLRVTRLKRALRKKRDMEATDRLERNRATAASVEEETYWNTVVTLNTFTQPQKKKRKCLKCGVEFISDSPGNRLCGPHRYQNARQPKLTERIYL